MSSIFPWSDAYLLGYGPMDETHREFVSLVASMLSSEAGAAALLERFADHAERHFSQEREWMESTDFPATECHANEHDAVLASVRDVLTQVAAGDASRVPSLAQALMDWFPGHADYMDASLAQWLAKRRLGGVPVVLKRNILAREEAGARKS